jgi:hypothetical protein
MYQGFFICLVSIVITCKFSVTLYRINYALSFILLTNDLIKVHSGIQILRFIVFTDIVADSIFIY